MMMSNRRRRKQRRRTADSDVDGRRITHVAEALDVLEEVGCDVAVRFSDDPIMGMAALGDYRLPVAVFEPHRAIWMQPSDGPPKEAQVEGIIQAGFSRLRPMVIFGDLPDWTVRQTADGLELVEQGEHVWGCGQIKPDARWLRAAEDEGRVLAVYSTLAGVRRPPDVTSWTPAEAAAEFSYAASGGLVAAGWVQWEASPIPDLVEYRGPSYNPKTGRFAMGVGANGAVGTWTLHTPGEGMRHGLIAGDRGLGKSNFLRGIALEASQARRFSVFIAEPDGRHDIGEATTAAAYATASTVEETAAMLETIDRTITARQSTGGYTDPTPQRPGLLVLIDEAQQVFAGNPHAVALAERIVRDGGPAGVGLVVTTRGADLAYFGGSRALRSGLTKTQRAAMGVEDLDLLDKLAEPGENHTDGTPVDPAEEGEHDGK